MSKLELKALAWTHINFFLLSRFLLKILILVLLSPKLCFAAFWHCICTLDLPCCRKNCWVPDVPGARRWSQPTAKRPSALAVPCSQQQHLSALAVPVSREEGSHQSPGGQAVPADVPCTCSCNPLLTWLFFQEASEIPILLLSIPIPLRQLSVCAENEAHLPPVLL